MNPSGGAATQICAHKFDHRFYALPKDIQERVQRRIDELGRNLRGFSHQRLQGGTLSDCAWVIIGSFMSSMWSETSCI